jgi:hypothetical protein
VIAGVFDVGVNSAVIATAKVIRTYPNLKTVMGKGFPH